MSRARTHAARTGGPRSPPRTRTGRCRHHSSHGLRCSCRCGCSQVPTARCHKLQHSPVILGRPGRAHGQHSQAGGRGFLPAPKVLSGGFSRGMDARQGPPTSLAAEAGPPRGTTATSSHWVAEPIIGTGAPHVAAQPKPACRAHCRGGRVSSGARDHRQGAEVGRHSTHRPGSGCPCSRGGTGRPRSQVHRHHRARTQGRSPGSRAPSGPRDNLVPHGQSVSQGPAGPVWHSTEPRAQQWEPLLPSEPAQGRQTGRSEELPAPPRAAGCHPRKRSPWPRTAQKTQRGTHQRSQGSPMQ